MIDNRKPNSEVLNDLSRAQADDLLISILLLFKDAFVRQCDGYLIISSQVDGQDELVEWDVLARSVKDKDFNDRKIKAALFNYLSGVATSSSDSLLKLPLLSSRTN